MRTHCFATGKVPSSCRHYGFRHGCRPHLLRNDTGVCHIQRLLGHHDLDTTELYTRLDVEDLAQALESAFARVRKRRPKPLPKLGQEC
jgi:site-specific recombinase XerC